LEGQHNEGKREEDDIIEIQIRKKEEQQQQSKEGEQEQEEQEQDEEGDALRKTRAFFEYIIERSPYIDALKKRIEELEKMGKWKGSSNSNSI
jgi:hypothetical protein